MGILKDTVPANTLAIVWYPFYTLTSAKSKAFTQEVTRPGRILEQTWATVLRSEQHLRFATELADRVYIIEKGEIRCHGTPAELAGHPEVRQKDLMV